MGLAGRIVTKYLIRLDELIAEGAELPMERHSRQTTSNFLSGEGRYMHFDLARLSDYVKWRTSCIAVLDQVVPPSSLLHSTLLTLPKLDNKPNSVRFAIGFLRSVRKELEGGFLDPLVHQVETEILSDHLDLAMATLAGSKDEPNHIAAAVIAGAALERSLRTICAMLEPPAPVARDGRRPTMNALIDAIKGRQVFNELQAKELRAWASLRNEAAHGHFDAFSRTQVEDMVSGVVRFVTDHSR